MCNLTLLFYFMSGDNYYIDLGLVAIGFSWTPTTDMELLESALVADAMIWSRTTPTSGETEIIFYPHL